MYRFAAQRILDRIFPPTTQTLFGPNVPMPVTAMTTQNQPIEPRRMSYPQSVNLSVLPRRDFPRLTSYEMLRTLAEQHPLAALCIAVRSEQIANLDIAVVAKRGNEQVSLQRDCDDYTEQLLNMDGGLPAWLMRLVRDVLEIDATSLWPRMNRAGECISLVQIDGSTIKPLIDSSGDVVAYQQVLYGLPLSVFLQREVGVDEQIIVDEFSANELRYLPYVAQVKTPYGRPPMEDMLLRAQTYLAKQRSDRDHFTEGNIPAALGIFNDDNDASSVEQVLEFERQFNASLQGDIARGSKIKFIPYPVRVERLRELTTGGQYESAFERETLTLVAAHYGVTPNELGVTDDVNRANAESQENVQYRRSIKPMTRWIKRILDQWLALDLKRPDLMVAWQFGEAEDSLVDAQRASLDIASNVITADESRAIRYPQLPARAAPTVAPPVPTTTMIAAIAKAADPDEPDHLIDETTVAEAVDVAMSEQYDELVKVVRATDEAAMASAPGVFFTAAQVNAMAQSLLPLFDDLIPRYMREAVDTLSVGLAWDVVNEAAIDLAGREAALLAGQLNKTSQVQALKIIEQWMKAPTTKSDLIARLARIYGAGRAESVGVTTVTRLVAKANLEAWQKTGVVQKYRWNTSRDRRVCPICESLNGREFFLSDNVPSASHPPAHGRCRCWVTPIVSEVTV